MQRQGAFFMEAGLFNLRFLVNYVFTNNRIVFHHFDLFGLGSFIFGRCVKMTCFGAGNQLDFISHLYNLELNLLATGAKISQHGIDTFLIDKPQSGG